MPSADNMNAALNDAEFLACDFRKRVAEMLCVIKGDGRQDDDIGCNDVCCVEAPTESDFHDGPIDLLCSEMKKSRERCDLEKGEWSAGFAKSRENAGQGDIGDRATVDDVTLVQSDEMRRRR